MMLEDLHSYYQKHGIRAAAKKAGMRVSKLQQQFEDAGLDVRRHSSIPSDIVVQWHARYINGMSLPELENKVGVSRKRIIKLFEDNQLELKTTKQRNDEKVAKIKATNIINHNVDNVMKVESVVEKLKETVRNRTDEDRQETERKRKTTCVEKYKNEYYVLTDDFKNKAEATFITNHGVRTASLSTAIVEQRTQTRLSNRASRLIVSLAERGYELVEQYVGNRVSVDGKHVCWRPYKVRHECGTVFEDDVYMFPRCPKCYPLNRSEAEIELEKWLCGWGEQVDHGVRDLITNPASGRGYEIDLLLRERKLGIEYNGSFYHAGRKNHSIKSDLCLSVGYRLIHVWDFNRIDSVKSRLSATLGIVPSIYARNCEVKEIDLSMAKEFVAQFHMQGSTLASYAYGLFLDEDLVSVLTLRRTAGMLEIARFCSKHFIRITGGFQKLLAAVRKQFKEPLLTYADRDWCPDWRDSVYAKSGFTFEYSTGPILRYVNLRTHEVSSRERYQRYKLQELFPDIYDEYATAEEILVKADIVPIWNSGNFRFVMK